MYVRYTADLDDRVYSGSDISIFRSACNVHVDTLIEYDSKGKRHPFSERFDEE